MTAVIKPFAGRWTRPQSQVAILTEGVGDTAVSPTQGVSLTTSARPMYTELLHNGRLTNPGMPKSSAAAKKTYINLTMPHILSNLGRLSSSRFVYLLQSG